MNWTFTGSSHQSARRRRQILAYLHENGVATALDISDALGIGERTVHHHVRTLVAKGKVFGHRGIGISLSSDRPPFKRKEY